ncbi:MAG: archaetidylserine decarboxylase [Alysiella sp.]|uniref:archaetidylserine decarboxylase n=1 Tax=Alysiella sp. TaxID=1872483 RepID=UPI0026DD3F79|nr:archaetidylserine decarboxylase [Alysiella sp.]MDO4434154.1 archaetidylserine decarboxylase [Alysiella sp.]
MSQLKPLPRPTCGERLKIASHYLLPQLAVTRLAGWFAEKKWGGITHAVIQAFAAHYQINLDEAEKSCPRDYASFNEFFIRPLKEGARPICEQANSLCLPADGKVSESGKIEQNRLLQAKGHSFTLSDLLANDVDLTAQFENGSFLTTYLSPRDYHRVHMPCDATLRRMIYVPGELFSVNPFLAQHIPNLFARNERLICVFETEFGSMVQILVGATVTASMSTVWAGVVNPPRPHEVREWHYPADGETVIRLQKGEEMGAFRLGSTVINLFPENTVVLDERLLAGASTKMGECLGIIQAA